MTKTTKPSPITLDVVQRVAAVNSKAGGGQYGPKSPAARFQRTFDKGRQPAKKP